MLALPGRLFLRPTTLRKVFDKTLAARRLPARCMSTKENSPYEANKKPKTDMADLLRVKKISEHATLPVRGSDGAAGYDLASAYDYVVPARGKELVKTDLSMAIPEGMYGRIAPRSGLAWKNFIDTGAGVIDADYRGEVKVLLFNHNVWHRGTPNCEDSTCMFLYLDSSPYTRPDIGWSFFVFDRYN